MLTTRSLSLLTVDGDGLGPDPDVDEVPLSSDPNGGLAAYINTALPAAALAARGRLDQGRHQRVDTHSA